MSHPLAALATAEAIVRSESSRRGDPSPLRAKREATSAPRTRPWWSRRARREAVLTRTPAAS
jgi:hypothetical protein